ncbi:MAG: SRPBCC family protein [Candidatus Rokuibacteriota bacterium]
MLEVRVSVQLAKSADDVWSVVGTFNGLPDWHPWVTTSVLESAAGGLGRRVTIVGGTAGRRDLTERLVSYDSAQREYAYTVIAGPTTFADYVGRLRVVPKGRERCVVEYHGRFRAAPGHTDTEATERIRTFWQAGLNNLPARFGT